MLGQPRLRELISAIEEAPLRPELWKDVCGRISGALRDAAVSSFLASSIGGIGFLLGAVNVGDSYYRTVAEQFSTPQTNPGINMMLKTNPGTVTPRERFHDDRELQRMPFYNEVMRPRGLWHAAILNLERTKEHLTPLGVMRGYAAGPFTPTEIQFLQQLLPYLSRSVAVVRRLREAEEKIRVAGDIIDNLPQGVILTDALGRVGSTNRAAESILQEADGILIHDGILCASCRHDQKALARLILEAGRGYLDYSSRPSGAMQVTRPSLRRPLRILVSPTRAGDAAFSPRLAVSVMVTDLERLPEAPPALLARLHGLSLREAEVAALLMQGHDPGTTAEQLNLSINTVRTHIRQLLLKTRAERIPDLIRILLQTPRA